MSFYLDFSSQKNAQSSLKLYINSCKEVVNDKFQWKKIITSIHNALHGFVVIALYGSDGYNTLREKDKNKVKKWHENPVGGVKKMNHIPP